MNRARSWLALSALVLINACSGGSSSSSEAPPPPPPTEVPTSATEVPTTAPAAVVSSIVTRAPSPATGCPAIDPGAAALPGTVHNNSIQGPETLDLAGSPHRFPDGLNVSSTLTVEPCALVLVATGQAIWMNGDATLVAVGDAQHPIRFDSIDPEATRGSWSGIYLTESATPRSRLAFVTVEDAGGSAGFVEPAAIHVTGDYGVAMNEITIRRSGGHGISMRGLARFAAGSAAIHVIESGNAEIGAGLVSFADASRVGTLPDLTFEGADGPEIVVVGDQSSTVGITQTWRNPGAGVRYHVRVDLTVEGATGPILTIAPGTTLAFDAGKGFYVGMGADGALVLDGHAEETRIVLTSARSVQSPADWVGLTFGEHSLASACRVAWTTISFTGAESGWANPHGCGQEGAAHFAIQVREHPIAAIEHLTVTSLGENAAAIQRGYISDQPADYTAAALGNDLASGNCAQTLVGGANGCPDPVPACAR